MKRFFIFLVIASHLFAQDGEFFFENTIAATMVNDPSSLVDGKVSAITGNPSLGSVDLIIQGAEPIFITRYYIPGREGEWNLAWDFAKATEFPTASYRWVLQERGEPPIIYKEEGTVKKGGEVWTRYSASKLNKGFSNTARPGRSQAVRIH